MAEIEPPRPSREQLEEDRLGNPLSLESSTTPGFRWTIKRRRFCLEFVRNGGQLTKAAEAAGYSQSSTEGSYLLTLTPIKQKIEKDLRNHLQANEVTENSVIARWQNWAECSPADYFEYQPVMINDGVDEHGVPVNERVGHLHLVMKNLETLTEQQRKALKKIVVRDTAHGQDIQIEVQDQAKANDRLAQTLGMLQSDSAMSNIPPPEEAAKLIHDFLKLADEADGTTPQPAANDGEQKTA